MKGSLKIISLMAVISLLLGVIWLPLSFAATVPTFAPLGTLGTKGSTGDYVRPIGVAMDAAGNFYVTDGNPMVSPGADRIVRFDAAGNKIGEIAGLDLSGPIAVKADGSEVYVALGQAYGGPGSGPGADGVAVINVATGAQRFIGAGAGADGRGEFTKVGALELDASGWLYVADGGFGAIKVYDATETYVDQIGAPCRGNGATDACEAGEFSSLVSFALDTAHDQVFASDRSATAYSPDATDTGNVQVFTLSTRAYKGVLLAGQMGGNANATESFENYYGLTVDGQRLFLTCSAAVLRGLDAVVVHPANAYLASYDLGSGATNAAVYDNINKRLVLSGDYGVVIVGVDGGSNPTQNDAPPIPAQVSPVANTIVATNSPTLAFAAVTDPNGDAVSYQVSLAQVGQTPVVTDVLTGTSLVTSGLVENAQYTWKVQAVDAKGAVSGWSAAGEFLVDAVNSAPAVPVLVSPLNQEPLGSAGLLTWNAVQDPDPGDSVTYSLEISSDPTFALNAVTQVVDTTSISISQLANPLDLVAGSVYYWRVSAVDTQGASSAFSSAGGFALNVTDLRVDSNLPGTKVYLGGNHGYAGQFVGVTPVVLRDLTGSAYSLVLVKPGFERLVETVQVVAGSNNVVKGTLRPAHLPQKFYLNWKGLQKPVFGSTAGQYENVNFVDRFAAPFMLDFDLNGTIDLLSGRGGNHGIALLQNMQLVGRTDMKFDYQVNVKPPKVPGGVPVFVDWNNDNLVDVVFGTRSGQLQLYLNQGTEGAPAYDWNLTVLQADLANIQVVGPAVPCFVDADYDGKKDLLVGSGDGKVRYYRNVGTDSAPSFTFVNDLVVLTSPAAPFVTDWDEDGQFDLLVATDNRILRYQNSGAMNFTYAEDLSLSRKNGKPMTYGNGLRVFAADVDGRRGKDLILGDVSGRVRIFYAVDGGYSPAFSAGLIEKVDQVQTLVDVQTPAQSTQVGAVRSAVQTGDYVAASLEVDTLLAGLDPATTAYTAANELKQLLQ